MGLAGRRDPEADLAVIAAACSPVHADVPICHEFVPCRQPNMPSALTRAGILPGKQGWATWLSSANTHGAMVKGDPVPLEFCC